jgi:hypothetical protein
VFVAMNFEDFSYEMKKLRYLELDYHVNSEKEPRLDLRYCIKSS